MYKQPKLNNGKFIGFVDDIMMKCSQHVKNVMIVGDLNVNFINQNIVFVRLLTYMEWLIWYGNQLVEKVKIPPY
jgi:hypothetical protein